MNRKNNTEQKDVPELAPSNYLDAVDANKTIADAISFQRAESSFDSNLGDGYVGLWREVQMKAEALYRVWLNDKIDKFFEEKKRDPTIEETLEMGDKIRKLSLFQEIRDLKVDEGDIRVMFSKDFRTSDDVWKNVFYSDYSHLQELNAYLGGLLPEEIAPLRMPDGRDFAIEYGIVGKDDGGNKRRRIKGKARKG